MKKTILILILLFSISNNYSQINNNPFDKLSKSLFENEMLSNRFIRNFTLIKTNSFKKRVLADMDQSLAKFDDNLSYIILHLPNNKNVEEDYMKLQNLWNTYRIYVTSYEKKNYTSLIKKTLKLDKLTTKLRKDILEEQNAYKTNSDAIKIIDLMVDNAKNIDQLLTSYILKNGLKFEKASSYYDIDFSNLHKNLKKITKYKAIDSKSLVTDLKRNLQMMSSLVEKDRYNPKMLFSDVNSYSKKTFVLFTQFLNTLKK